MSGFRIGCRVRLVRWIEMRSGRACVCRAAIAELMNVKSVFARSQTRYRRFDLYTVGNLGECNGAAHFVALGRMKYRNGF